MFVLMYCNNYACSASGTVDGIVDCKAHMNNLMTVLEPCG